MITKFTTTFSLSLALLLSSCGAGTPAQIEEVNYYSADWESLVDYQAPEWYEDAKLGLWPIWGVYSIPAFKGDHAAEWYGRWMYCKEGQSSRNNQGLATHKHHIETYGDPSEFGYKDFIPMFTAKNFDAEEWVSVCKDAGAKFFTTLAIFHDGFAMWDAKTTKWNAKDMGPKRDIVGELEKATRKAGLKFGVSNHLGWNFCFYQWNHINGYDAKDPANADLYGRPIVADGADTIRVWEGEDRKSFMPRSRGAVTPSEDDLKNWQLRTQEVAKLYKPDLYYFDWGFNIPIYEPSRREFASFYYNNAIANKQGVGGAPGVVINYKGWATFKQGSGVRDLERGGMEGIQDMVWQTDDCIYGGHNWGYAKGEPIKPTNTIVDELMDIISKRGVLMLAFAPKADGTIPDDQKQFLKELGSWLKICGEAVYSTRPYKIMGEVSESWGIVDSHGYKAYISSKEDIRYTRTKDNKTLYATLLEWPGDKINIKTLSDLDKSTIKSVQLVGVDKDLNWTLSEGGLEIELGSKPSYDFAYPIRISFK